MSRRCEGPHPATHRGSLPSSSFQGEALVPRGPCHTLARSPQGPGLGEGRRPPVHMAGGQETHCNGLEPLLLRCGLCRQDPGGGDAKSRWGPPLPALHRSGSDPNPSPPSSCAAWPRRLPAAKWGPSPASEAASFSPPGLTTSRSPPNPPPQPPGAPWEQGPRTGG